MLLSLLRTSFQTTVRQTRFVRSYLNFFGRPLRGLPKTLWPVTCLNTIDKANFIPIKTKDGKFKAPNIGIAIGSMKPDTFLRFGQPGFIVDTTTTRQKLQYHALKARYFRSTQAGQYLVLLTATDKTRLIRIDEFLVRSEAQANQP